jgi:outer membrane protein TolC
VSFPLLVLALVTGLVWPVRAQEHILELTLEETFRLALERNVGLQRAAQFPLIAQGELLSAKGGFDPDLLFRTEQRGDSLALGGGAFADRKELTNTLGFSHRTGSGLSYSVEHALTGTQTRLTPTDRLRVGRGDTVISLSYPLLQGTGAAVNKAPVYLAEKNVENSEYALKTTGLDVLANVEFAYWDLRRAQLLVSVRERSLARAQEFLDLLQEGVNEGLLAPYETLEAAQTRSSQEANLAAALRDLALAENVLLRILGMDQGIEKVSALDSMLVTAELPSLERALEIALEQRPEVRQAMVDIESREIELKVAENAMLPQLDLVTDYRLSSVRADLYSWRAGLEFSIPLGNRVARGQVQSTEAGLEEASLALEDVRQQVSLEVASALQEASRNRQQLTATDEALKQANLRVEAELERFKFGLTSAHRVNLAQQQLITLEQLQVLALREYRDAFVRLERALGNRLALLEQPLP